MEQQSAGDDDDDLLYESRSLGWERGQEPNRVGDLLYGGPRVGTKT